MMDKNEKAEPERISGTVDGIVCYKPESGFIVFDLDMNGELVTVVGELGAVEAGEEVTLTGSFSSHPTYGSQFRPSARCGNISGAAPLRVSVPPSRSALSTPSANIPLR